MKRLVVINILAMSVMACCAKKEGSTTAKTESTVSNNNSDGAIGQYPYTADFRVLEKSSHNGREKASNVIVKDHKELHNLYKELNLGIAPKVDFNREQVVAVFMGQKSSGGYSIGIDNITIKNGTAEVAIKETYPANDEMVTSALTAPLCIAAFPKVKQVVFLQDPPPMIQN